MTITRRSIYGMLAALPSPLSTLVRRSVSASLAPFKPRSTAAAISKATAPSVAPPHAISNHLDRSTPDKMQRIMPDGTDPFDFVAPEMLKQIFDDLAAHPHDLLQIRGVRQVLARERAKHFMARGEIK